MFPAQHLVTLVDQLCQRADDANLDETLTALAAIRTWARHKCSHFPQHL